MPFRTPITAFSACNGLGTSIKSLYRCLLEGEGGLQPFRDGNISTWCGLLPEKLPALTDALRDYDSRQARMCALAYDEIHVSVARAICRWGADRVGLVFGTSTGGIASTEHAFFQHARTHLWPSSCDVQRHHAISAALFVLRELSGILGPGFAISTACSSSAKVFATGKRLLDTGRVDAVLLGGVDTLCQLTIQGFASLEVLSANRCRPFGADRDGINIGEGGAFVLIERSGDSDLDLIAVGESSDAYHMTSPHPKGLGASLAMARALQQGQVGAEQIDHINAHATGTFQNDRAECYGIAEVIGDDVPVVATKSYTGHLLGAAGITEIVFSLLMMRYGFLPALPDSQPIDAELPVRLIPQGKAHRSNFALSNSLAFGGSNVSVLVGRRS